MRSIWYIRAMVVLAVLLALSPVYGFAAGPEAANQLTTGQALSSEKEGTWVCTFEPQRAQPQYYRGRAGQLEYRRARPDQAGQLQCKATTGDEVRVFRYCPS
jgi:hypothetical protein